jgi:arginine decarboxylase
MGAYQDIMGNMHHLLGRVNEVHVFLDPDEESGYYIEEVIEGTSIASVLDMVQHDGKALVRSIKKQIEPAISDEQLKPSEGMRLLADYTKGLRDQTYLSL